MEPDLYSTLEQLANPARPLLGATSLREAEKGFPVSRMGQVRDGRACLGNPRRGQLASLLALFTSLLPSMLQAAKVTKTSLWAASRVHRPSLALLWLKTAVLTVRDHGPRGRSRPHGLQGLGPRPCSSRPACMTLSRLAVLANRGKL